MDDDDAPLLLTMRYHLVINRVNQTPGETIHKPPVGARRLVRVVERGQGNATYVVHLCTNCNTTNEHFADFLLPEHKLTCKHCRRLLVSLPRKVTRKKSPTLRRAARHSKKTSLLADPVVV